MTAAAAACGRGQSEQIDVWLILGDSEAGQGGTLTDLPDFYPPANGTLFMISQSDLSTLSELSEPSNPQTTTWGIGGLFAYKKGLKTGRKTCVCNCPVSGTDSTYYLFSASTSSGYYRAVTSVKAALRNPGATFAGILLYGGANDGSLASPAWDTNWTQALSDIRSGIGAAAASTPVWYIQLPNATPIAPYSTSWTTVRSQQASWATATSPARTMIAASTSWTWGDIQYVHLNGQGIDDATDDIVTAIEGSLGTAPSADPTTISGLILDLHAGTETSTSGGVVDSLGNTVGSDAFTQTGTARPAYSASDAGWNSKPLITFDTSNDSLISDQAAASWNGYSDGSARTWFLAWETPNDSDLFSTYMGSGTGGLLIRHQGTSLIIYISTGASFSNNWVSSGVTIPKSRKNFAAIRYSSSHGVTMRRDGSSWQTLTVNGAVTPPASCSYTGKLGSGFYFGGVKFGRALAYNRILTTSECNLIGAYMKNDYALPGRFG